MQKPRLMESHSELHHINIILNAMADLNPSAGSLRGRRRTTLTPKVDMTPMVDLMFLLITFFMLTTTLSKPTAMPLALPIKEITAMPIANIRTINICLGKDNRLQWYMGDTKKPLSPPVAGDFGKEGIRQVLRDQNKRVIQETGSSAKGLIAIIKPSDKSNYKNLVDILDELKISGIGSYFISDIENRDLENMKKNNMY